jgi:hypothetical protein
VDRSSGSGPGAAAAINCARMPCACCTARDTWLFALPSSAAERTLGGHCFSEFWHLHVSAPTVSPHQSPLKKGHLAWCRPSVPVRVSSASLLSLESLQWEASDMRPYDRQSASGDSTPSAAPAKPATCPFCGSRGVGTLAKVITESTCWRCQGCGESFTSAQAAARSAPRPR